MKTEIENALKLLLAKVSDGARSDDALKYTQAALNLAHTLAAWSDAERMIRG